MHVIDAEQPEWQRFPEMADDDLEVRKAIEYATGDQRQQMHSGLHTKSVNRTIESALQQRTDQVVRWAVRM